MVTTVVVNVVGCGNTGKLVGNGNIGGNDVEVMVYWARNHAPHGPSVAVVA